MDVDRLATVAWWAARSVTDIVAEHITRAEAPLKTLQSIRTESIGPVASVSEVMWQMRHPCSGDASIRVGTIFCPQPRSLALLIRMARCVGGLPEPKDEQRHMITTTFVQRAFECFPIDAVPSADGIWAFDSPLSSSFREWCAVALPDDERAELNVPLALCEAIENTGKMIDELKNLADAPEPSRTFFASFFRILAYCKADATDRLWALVMDREWRTRCFKQLTSEALQAMFDGFMELAGRVEDRRKFELPHVFAEQCESDDLDPERRSLFLGLTVVAAANTGTVSAIRRVMSGVNQTDFAENVVHWRERIRHMLPSAPPVLAGNLRDVLSSLRNV